MRARRWLVQSVHQPSVLKAPMDLSVQPMGLKDLPHESLQYMSMPIPLFAGVYVEGVDSPFFTRLWEGEPNVPQRIRTKIIKNRLTQSVFYNGMSFPVFQSSVSEEPLLNGKILENHVRTYRVKGRIKTRTAYTASLVYGTRPYELPAINYSVTVQEIIDEIRRHLLEDMSVTTWSLWTETEVYTFIQQRVVRFLMETGIVRERITQAHPEQDDTADLPRDLLELRRVAWEGVALPKTDAFVMDHGQSGWYSGTDVPFAYIEEPRDPLSIQLVKTPTLAGTLDLIYIAPIINVVDPHGQRNPYLPIPAAFCPHLKYGVMADMLLKEGEAHDPIRAEHCSKRYEEGVQLAKLWIGAFE